MNFRDPDIIKIPSRTEVGQAIQLHKLYGVKMKYKADQIYAAISKDFSV